MLKQKLLILFKQYIAAFKNYDMAKVQDCYHLPCTLHTPDNVVYLSAQEDLFQEFNNIFEQLKQAKTSDIKPIKASFTPVNEKITLVCVDWDFIDEKNQVFADFSAFYHILDVDGDLKIFNVVSQDLSNSKTLANEIKLK